MIAPRRLHISFALLALTATLPRPARAQDPQSLQVAQAIYDQAVKDMAAKSFATACPRLEEAVRLVPEGVGAKLTLAECYEGWGKLASAFASYGLAEAAAARAKQADRQKLAHDRGEALRPKLAMLTITVTEPARSVPGLVVKRDGVLVGQAQWGLPLPADKGKHVITAGVGDGRTWEKTVEITADGARETVGIADLPGAPPPPPAPDARPPEATSLPRTPPPAPPPEAPSNPRRTAGIVLSAVGGAGLAVGLGLGGLAMSKKSASNADNHCDAQNRCDPTGTDLRNQSLAAGNAATGVFVAGALALAGGVVLVITAPSASAPSTGSRPFTVGVNAGGVTLSGKF